MQVRQRLEASVPGSHLEIRLLSHIAPAFHRCSETTTLAEPKGRWEEVAARELGGRLMWGMDHFHWLGISHSGGCNLAVCLGGGEKGFI